MTTSPPRLFALAVLASGAGLASCAAPTDGANVTAGSTSTALLAAPLPAVTYRVATTAADLVAMLNEASPGAILIPDGVGIDLTAYKHIPLKAGVHLMGGRGGTAEGGRLFTNERGTSTPPGVDPNYTLFEVAGDDVHVEGLRIDGPWPYGDKGVIPAHATGIGVDGSRYRRFLIERCEMSGWNEQAISIGGPAANHTQASDWVVRDNYIHDNVMDGAGYGVDVGNMLWATIEGNVFDHNRHAIASDGSPGSGYIARYNYILEGGRCEPSTFCYYDQHFDVHGTGSGGYGGGSGEYFDISLNTFRGDQTYGLTPFLKTRPALWVRGQPSEGAYFHDNIVVHPDVDAAVRTDSSATHVWAYSNNYHTDVSSDVLVGDLDADGRDDLFLATATAWFASYAGLTEWRRINVASQRTSDLALGQFDDDPRLDVFTVMNGAFFYSSGGTSPWKPLGVVTGAEPTQSLRFGHFDANGKTDVIRTDGSLVWVSYDGVGPWLPLTQAQNIPFTDLRFGDLDGNGKTDMFRIGGSTWYWKKDGIGGWLRLNDAKTTSLSGVVLADFDGNGKADVGLLAGSAWGYWADGTSATMTPLSTPSSHDVSGGALAVGKMAGDAQRADVLAWGASWYQNGEYDHWGSPIAISVDGTAAWLRWSRHPMR